MGCGERLAPRLCHAPPQTNDLCLTVPHLRVPLSPPLSRHGSFACIFHLFLFPPLSPPPSLTLHSPFLLRPVSSGVVPSSTCVFFIPFLTCRKCVIHYLEGNPSLSVITFSPQDAQLAPHGEFNAVLECTFRPRHINYVLYFAINYLLRNINKTYVFYCEIEFH